MPYYQGDGDEMYARGDYYRGDYYQGDPFSLGGLIKGAAGFIGKALVPSPVRAIVDVGRSLVGGGGGTAFPVLRPPPFGGPLTMQGEPGKVLVRPGGAGGIPQRPMVDIIPRGRHLNKSTYVTRGGGTSHWPMQILVHPPHTETVPNRHVNYGNARALRRALRRARGFARLARTAGYISRSYKKSSGSKKKR